MLSNRSALNGTAPLFSAPVNHRGAAADLDEVAGRIHRKLVGRGGSERTVDADVIHEAIIADAPLLSAADVDAVARRVGHQLFALGPLESLLADPTVTEIMVNGPDRVWIERAGVVAPVDLVIGEAMLQVIIERIVGPLGLRVDRTQPFADARLLDGSRVHIAVPPLALDGPYLTIRRFGTEPHELSDFCTPDVATTLVNAVRSRRSLVVSGGTGSGKTSLLNALGVHIPSSERIITIEDAAELRLPGDHVVRLEARPPNAEGVGGFSIRSLVRNALRMRPDRLVVGEVRGGEALDMVQAMNTGHDGSMSTCHANSPIDTLRRIESMMLMGDVDMPIEVARDHVRSAIGLVIFVARGSGGARQVTQIYDQGADRWLFGHRRRPWSDGQRDHHRSTQ